MASSRRRALTGVLVAATMGAGAVGMAGCGGDSADSAAPSTTETEVTTTESTTTSTTTVTEEEAILAANQGYWDTWILANNPPNPDHPDLARYATGAALESNRSSITENQALGRAFRARTGGQARHSTQIEARASEFASVVDCSIDDGVVVDVLDGSVLDDSVATWLYRTTLQRSPAGDWRVAFVNVESRWEGVAGCAVSS